MLTMVLKELKLEIYGNPATIKSNTIDGEAEAFVIYPNKSMNLIGNAKLVNNGNASGSDILNFTNSIKKSVQEEFNIDLEEEVKII